MRVDTIASGDLSVVVDDDHPYRVVLKLWGVTAKAVSASGNIAIGRSRSFQSSKYSVANSYSGVRLLF